ncbi:MAG TPA: site-specific integrase [Pyrinomonadaceae bacterium]|nr:site-specific integrase [Pyrinomonadaceae bacterium]
MAVFRRRYKDTDGKWKLTRTFYYDFWVQGRRYRGSIPGARTKAQAERAETKIRDSVYEGKYGKAVHAPILATFVAETYLPHSRQHKRSWKHDEFRVRPLLRAFGKYQLDEISQIQIERYKRDRARAVSKRGRALSPASVNRELELLSAIFSHATHLGVFVGTNPCHRVKRLDEDNERTRILFYEEEERLMAELVDRRAHLAPIVQLAIHTMLRKTELLSLRKANLDFERGLIWASNSGGQRTKSKKNRPVPMNSVARQMLFELCRASESEYVFPIKKTGSYIRDIKTAFNSACRDAQIKDFRFHDLRRTGATRLGEAGADAFYITAVLGHADVNTSQVYTIATNEGLRRAMESLTRKPKPTVTEVPTNEERLPERTAVSA